MIIQNLKSRKIVTKIVHYVLSCIIILLLQITIPKNKLYAQGFLHVNGKNIVNGDGENIILRGIGTGNWMLQEGYMMQSSSVAGTQHEFRAKLIETVGVEKTKEFYNEWLANHFTKTDVDSMAAWGFNSVRVALHYKWFTPPIEDEPVLGEITWIDKGFTLLDNLLAWCKDNNMYLILDLHGAPGGQGYDAAISDYDSSKPSLWESELNKNKTVALWRAFAERYKNEEWIGGYDLINEVNWNFEEANNAPLRALYERITDTIREVDNKHILFIEGNWFANDYTGLTPAWDDNMVYSFHKYWTYNDVNSIKWVLNLRDQQNRPIWLGETGENSNTWFTNLVSLAETNNIGWSWWPVKKSGINNVLYVETNEDYTDLIENWKNNNSVDADDAYNAVMTWANNHIIENCNVRYDVIDALIRQAHTTETKAFKKHNTGENIFAVDYDLGRNNYAYFDKDTANYSLNTNEFEAWNIGWEYRNDGVDIEECSDNTITNGYSVGWMSSGEWLLFTINSEANAAYKFQIRTANEKDAYVRIEVNDIIVSENIKINATGAWDTWETTLVNGIILPVGEIKVKVILEEGTINLNYFSFTEPVDADEIDFMLLQAITDPFENKIHLHLNKDITSSESKINSDDFQIILNNSLATISSFEIQEDIKTQLSLSLDNNILKEDGLRISYNGSSILNEQQCLNSFSLVDIINVMNHYHKVPGKFEAEDFFVNKGFELENCSDDGGGLNTSYANEGDYLDYLITVDKPGLYQLNLRVASAYNGAEITILSEENGVMVTKNIVKFENTGGWQSWQTKAISFNLKEGKQILRIQSRSGEYNMNWFSFDFLTSSINEVNYSKLVNAYPNPATDEIIIELPIQGEKQISVFNLNGIQVFRMTSRLDKFSIPVKEFASGIYIIRISGKNYSESIKIQVTK